MKESTESSELQSKKYLWLFPLTVLVICLISTSLFTYFIHSTIQANQKIKFEAKSNQISDAIHDRFSIYVSALYGGRGLFEASVFVDRNEFKEYVSSLNIQENYPGIQGIGFSLYIPNAELQAHEEVIQQEGFPDYTVRPPGVRAEYTSIIYLEPFDVRNRQAFGFDMFQETTRNEAMSRARDTGDAALTGKVTLVQEIDQDVQAGFLVYVPVYKKDMPTETVEERQRALFGYVYSPFRMNDFMKGIDSSDLKYVNVEVFNSNGDFGESNRMFGKIGKSESLIKIETFIFGGNTWTIRYSTDPNFEIDAIYRYTPLMVALAGGLLSFALFFLVYSVKTQQYRALAMAKSITKDLEKRTKENEKIRVDLEITNKHLEENSKNLAEKVAEFERVNKLMVGRELRIQELKEEVDRLKGTK